MISNSIFENMLNNPVREFRGRVEFYEGSTLALMCGCHDNLKSFTIERVGEANKFFGYGICQKINVHLVDLERKINLSTNNTVEVVFGTGSDYIYPCPRFHITEVRRDETTNELSITAYDDLYAASAIQISEVLNSLGETFTIKDVVIGCGVMLGLPIGELDEAFNDSYVGTSDGLNDGGYGGIPQGQALLNLDGSETIRDVLTAVAEATQTIYFIDWDWKLQFKRLDVAGEPVLTIDKDKYFTLDSGDNRRLTKLCHATELGDNMYADISDKIGTTQYIYNNPFWTLRPYDPYLMTAAARVGELTINQFDCSWRGNFLLEIGDKIAITTKDDNVVYSYLLNDVMSFDGSLSQKSEWKYTSEATEYNGAPASLGEVLNQTSAKVDKVNKLIELQVNEISAVSEKMAELTLDTESITATVAQVTMDLMENLVTTGGDIAELKEQVNMKMDAEQLKIEVQKEVANGVNSVTTSTGFTFNEDGLTVSKTGSEMTTQITEDGMAVFRDNNEVLTADNTGVKAENLHATTYLIIGKNSRLEDWNGRTGCFWIGG